MKFIGAYFLRRHFPEMSQKKIAQKFDITNHTSIINSLYRANALLDTKDPIFTPKFQKVEAHVNIFLSKIST
jgi:hypothetical protein